MQAKEQLGLTELQPFEVVHIRHSCGVRLVSKQGWSMVFSGDSRPCPQLAAATPVPHVPGIPWVGPLNRLNLMSLFVGITELHREFKSRSLSFDLMGLRAVYVRHPEDIVHIMRTHADRYCKGVEQLAAMHEFLGEGLVTLPDGARHAEARAVLDPGFRAEFVKGMLPTMAAVAQELVDTMLFKL
ncbi:uncharacterized protein HaLaN_12764 [Haematococcus lacustris]|uniref:ribonuclease Z n=1 Tax=Haematococcus lacustris TaxID=44745 RepID=A0A699Z2S3_HAELA|nr:uncharacterized protein HaLaN_12764 [Haematococcus lacustris]